MSPYPKNRRASARGACPTRWGRGSARRRVVEGLVGALLLGVCSCPALAREPAPRPQAPEASPYKDQLDADITVVPEGYGSVFVPALESGRDDDASVIVELDGETLAVGRLGQRIALPPGHYNLFVGSGPKETRARAEANVAAGATSTVSPNYGVLRVSIVDGHGTPDDATFVVAAASDPAETGRGRVYGPFRPSFKPGQRAANGLYLPPGRYVLALGDNPKTLEGSVALLVAQGEVLHYRVVVEDGHLLRTEFGEADVVLEPSIYRLKWTLAADGTLGSRLNQLSSYNGDALTLGAYSRLELGIDTGRHLAEVSLFADLAAVGILSSNGASEFPIQKVTDDVRAEVLYNYRLGGVAGPYAHVAGFTSLFPTRYYAPTTLHAVTTNEGGSVVRDETFVPSDTYRLFPELGPLILQEGAGIGTKLDFETFRFAVRGGLATRQAFFFRGRTVTAQAGRELALLELSDVKTIGMEGTAMAGVTLRNVLDLDSRLDVFLGEDQFGSVFKGEGKYRPIYRWDTAAAIRLSRHVSLVYTLGLRRDTQALERDQIAHSLRLRLLWSVF